MKNFSKVMIFSAVLVLSSVSAFADAPAAPSKCEMGATNTTKVLPAAEPATVGETAPTAAGASVGTQTTKPTTGN